MTTCSAIRPLLSGLTTRNRPSSIEPLSSLPIAFPGNDVCAQRDTHSALPDPHCNRFLLPGQEFRGSITGKVTDPNGAVVAGATVTVNNTGTNAEVTAVTNTEGTYDFPVLLPGKYKLLVTKDGFKVEVREQIEIRVADKLTI